MSAAAKGTFPGRPKRKIEKKKAKFKHSLHKEEFEDLKLTCSFITNISYQFHRIFDDKNEQDIEFIGFSSEECGLQAYKKISRKKHIKTQITSPSHSDILSNQQIYNKEQVTTRLSHARDSLSSPEKDYTSPKRPTFIFNKDTESSSGSSDSAFLKYKDFKLDFHRLSKKAKNRDEISAEDLANRKDTSVASLKYASEIYLAKHQDVLQGVTRSPIKPATFIPPLASSRKTYVVGSETTSSLIKKASKLKEMYDLKKRAGHPHTLAKALLARANRQNRKNTSDPSPNKPRATKTFVLPTKSTRSSRIIKANRKYIDQDVTETPKISKSGEAKECIVEVPRIPTQSDLEQESEFLVQGLKNTENKTSPRKPLIKEPTFYANENKSWNDQLSPNGKKSKYKLPTITEPICIDDSNSDDAYHSQKQVIKEATFMGPKKSKNKILESFGLKKDELKRLLKPNCSIWKLGKTERQNPNWTVQEIHNILHGAHTFGPQAWPSIARQYEFHELHRDWKSVKDKASDCAHLGLLNSAQKVKNSIFTKLDPTLSSSPNVTVYTASELQARGLISNITCDLTKTENLLSSCDLPVSKKHKKSDKDMFLGLGFKDFQALLRPRKPPVQKWSAWEIHNILHGVHYFGLYNWHKIMKLYKFKPGRDPVVLRGRLKAACCRGLFKEGKLKPSIISKLHPLLKKQGKHYFTKHHISITGHSSFESEDTLSSSSPNKPKRARLKQPSLEQTGFLLSNQNEIFSEDTDTAMSTPVLEALEDGLRQNKTPSTPINNHTDTNSAFSSPNTTMTPPHSTSSTNIATNTITTPPTQSGNNKQSRKTSKDKTPVSNVKAKGKGPRIKHVCRRASLVTGQSQATYEDHAPHLSALPKGEREKVIAQSEKEKVQVPQFTSSESEMDLKMTHKATVVNHHVRKERGKKKTANLTTRCRNCEACLAPPCGECETCKSTKENEESLEMICLKLEACLNPQPENNSKKNNKKIIAEQQTGSRKSSRLQQQRVPLKSSRVNDPPVTSSLLLANPMTSLMTSSNFNQSMSYYLKNNNHVSLLSPSSQNRAYQDFKAQQAIVRIDNWKETYDYDFLWKTGGRALITSHPPPPRIICFLCGSFHLPGVQDTTMIYCSCCCEPFHHYCVGIKSSSVRKYLDNKKWICRRCQYCRVCGHTKNLLECKRCKKAYHSDCLGPSYPTKPSESNVWVCMQCVRCQSCGTSKPGTLPGSTWTHDFTMCQRCGDLFDRGNYCPICERCYSDEDYDTRMVQCADCKRWVHSKCENLSVELYTLLSYMPDNVHYKCPDCDGRGEKLNAILNENLNQDLEKKDQQPDAEKIRSILSELPPPKWKKMMESEIQSGLEAITMALFHNRAIFCVLKKNGSNMDSFTSSPLHCPSPIYQQDQETTNKLRSQDLFAVRFAVHNHKYQSVGAFCSDVRTILDTVSDESDRFSVERAFRDEASSVFSWFNFETGRVRDVDEMPEDLLPNAIMPPLPEHDYAQWQDKDITICPGTPTQSPMKPLGSNTPSKGDVCNSPFKGSEDLRQCVMCNNYGDDTPRMCGRLLYCGQDEWCHVNCALWSAEVYEQHDGSLQNVHSAASRGRMMRCDDCRLPGATLGCNTRDCPKSFHFKCARQVGCAFLENKQVFCPKHRFQARKEQVVRNSEFEVARLVCIDNDEMRPNRRWQRGVSAGSVLVTIGALTVHQLGRLGMSSDTKECLLPVSYRMTRVFWSTFSVTRKAVYTITITERKSSQSGNPEVENKVVDEDYHLTISHNNDDMGSKTTPKTSRKQSQDSNPPYRSNLLSKMEDSTSHIGPLSPRSCSGKRKTSREAGGRYTIMSSLNKTLPQQVTPHPMAPAVAQSSQNFNSSLVKTAKVTPGNPFLNENSANDINNKNDNLKLSEIKPVFKDTTLQNSLKSDLTSVTKPQHLVSDKITPDFKDKNLPGLSKSDTATLSDTTNIADSDGLVLLQKNVSITSNVTLLHTENNYKPTENIKNCVSNSELSVIIDQVSTFTNKTPLVTPLQSGSSGSFNQANETSKNVPENTSKILETKTEFEFELPVLPNSVTSTPQYNLNEVQLQKTVLPKNLNVNEAKLEVGLPILSSELLSQVKYEENKNLIQNKLDLCPSGKDNKHLNSGKELSDNSLSPPVISLLASAKLAHQMENTKPNKTQPQIDLTSGLWWKKGNNLSSTKSKIKKLRHKTSFSDEDLLEDKTSSRRKRGGSFDKDFVLPSSANPVWKRRPGEMSLDVATRANTRSKNNPDCKSKNSEDKILESLKNENQNLMEVEKEKCNSIDGSPNLAKNNLNVEEDDNIAVKECLEKMDKNLDEKIESPLIEIKEVHSTIESENLDKPDEMESLETLTKTTTNITETENNLTKKENKQFLNAEDDTTSSKLEKNITNATKLPEIKLLSKGSENCVKKILPTKNPLLSSTDIAEDITDLNKDVNNIEKQDVNKKSIASENLQLVKNEETNLLDKKVDLLFNDTQPTNVIVTEINNSVEGYELSKKTKKLSDYALQPQDHITTNDLDNKIFNEKSESKTPENIKNFEFSKNDLKLPENLEKGGKEEELAEKVDKLNSNKDLVDLGLEDDSLSNVTTSTTSEPFKPKLSINKTNSEQENSLKDEVSHISNESEDKNVKELTKTKLRQFSSQIEKRVTRSSRLRSKSYDITSTRSKKLPKPDFCKENAKLLKPVIALTRIPNPDGKNLLNKDGKNLEKNGSPVDLKSLENDDLSSRRYPRRNTYTCLKSFSGLSPKYALASYSRMQEKQRNEKLKQKGSRKKLKSTKKFDKKNFKKVAMKSKVVFMNGDVNSVEVIESISDNSKEDINYNMDTDKIQNEVAQKAEHSDQIAKDDSEAENSPISSTLNSDIPLPLTLPIPTSPTSINTNTTLTIKQDETSEEKETENLKGSEANSLTSNLVSDSMLNKSLDSFETAATGATENNGLSKSLENKIENSKSSENQTSDVEALETNIKTIDQTDNSKEPVNIEDETSSADKSPVGDHTNSVAEIVKSLGDVEQQKCDKATLNEKDLSANKPCDQPEKPIISSDIMLPNSSQTAPENSDTPLNKTNPLEEPIHHKTDGLLEVNIPTQKSIEEPLLESLPEELPLNKPNSPDLETEPVKLLLNEPKSSESEIEPVSNEPQKLISCTPLYQINSEMVQQPVVDRSVELSPTFKSTEDLSILDELESMSESVEIFRGGNPENKNSVSDNISLPDLATSPLSKSFDLQNCDQNNDLTGPSEMDIVEPSDAALESMKNDVSFLAASECPVLNADEVKTLLEEPVTTKQQFAYVQQNLPQHQQQTTMNFTSPIQRSGVNMNYTTGQKLFAQPQVYQAPYCVELPVVNAQNAVHIQQYQPVLTNQNIMFNSPNQHGYSGSILSPFTQRYVVPNVGNQPQMYQPANNVQMMMPNPVPIQCHAVNTGVPYSVHVTMAMAGSTNQDFARQTVRKNLAGFNPQMHMNSKTNLPRFTTQKQNLNQGGFVASQQTFSGPRQFAPSSNQPRNKSGQFCKLKSKETGSNDQLKQQQQQIHQQSYVQQSQQQQVPILQAQQQVQKQQQTPKSPEQSSEQEAALESLIDFYSTKNNLNDDERAIVRSIIKSQIQTNQLPMPSAESSSDLSVKKETVRKTSTEKSKTNSEPRATKRRLSQENQKKKLKMAKKNKTNETDLMKNNIVECLNIENDKENDISDSCSVLVDVYNNRKKLARNEKKPLTQVMSSYNVHLGDQKTNLNKENRLPPPPTGSKPETKNSSKLVYEIRSDDGYLAKGTDLDELVRQLFTAVQECHSSAKGTTPTIALHQVMTPAMFLGVSHDAVRYLVEQLPGARNCHRYRAKYHKHKKAKTEITHINPHGCCRAEQYKGRSKPDMFSFLASKHRPPPEFQPERTQDDDMSLLSNRRATSMEQLPMAMRFRHLRTFSHEAVGVFRSSIHGRGLFCKRDFEAGEMIMEYTGQKIRRILTDKREKYYESKQIGCYMFRMDDMFVVDATILGNGARFINHSCEPNCYSRIVNIEGNKHIVIFALRKLYRGEELTYDYKFPIEDETQKITCNCGARLCRKFMN